MSQSEYVMRNIYLSEGQKKKLARDAKNNCQSSIKLTNKTINQEGVDFAFSVPQANKLDAARRKNMGVQLKVPKKVMKYNQKLQEGQEGGFLPLLMGLARVAAPIIGRKVLPALATGALGGLGAAGVNKILGDGLYLKKGGDTVQIETDGDGLFLKPYRGNGLQQHGDGLFLRQHGKTYDGSGLIFGQNSPLGFLKGIPLLGPAINAVF